MLIIFDLDDTLIETWRCLTPKRLGDALKSMMAAGLEVASFEEAFSRLLELNQKALNSRAALEAFAGKESPFLKNGLNALTQPLEEETEVTAAEGAIELLEELKENFVLGLVTLGVEELQLQKMKKAGIQPEWFSKLIVGNGPNKKLYYEQMLSSLNGRREKTLVCGDRIPIDLTPAKALGLTTVHITTGRGKFVTGVKEDVDYTIDKLSELKEIIKNL